MALAPQSQTSVAQAIGEDVTVFVGPMVLVSSRSRHGDYHSVMDGKCSCLGFEYRGRCRHLAVAASAQEQDRLTAQAPDPTRCQRCNVKLGAVHVEKGDLVCCTCRMAIERETAELVRMGAWR